ncbi:MAG: bifunctional protein-serine/threonine kinase/phosphatase, partial [Zoogloea sp.]|nr:bifunctional protein-serine/threonine kinase/phosphatase [Zoogloea sp.]
WSVTRSLDTVIGSLNRWLVAHAAKRREAAGMATTLSCMVLRGTRFHVAHVGDSRIYRYRAGERARGTPLVRLTTDHVWEHPELDNVLSRAVGLDARLTVDFTDGEVELDDLFVLLTDGVWNQLGDERIAALLAHGGSAQEIATRLADSAEKGGSSDNCTALVLRVTGLPADRLPDNVARLQRLPLPPRLKPGQTLDGLTVEEVIHASMVTLLYRVHDEQGRQLVLKTLLPERDDLEFAAALAYEEWLAGRVMDAQFPQVVPAAERSCLYYLMTWHAGATLRARQEAGYRFSPAEVADLGERLMRGLAALHRLSIVHRDIKPDNLHLGADGRLRILDLGVAASDGQDFREINNPGTPSFMAPELYADGSADECTDLYAAGVTLYNLLTRKYPYGEIEPFQKPRFGDPVPPTRYRPDIPAWLEAVILKAVARDRADRFETAEEFLLALERGAHAPLRVPRKMPLMQRDPQLGLKLLAAGSLVLNVLLIYLMLVW